MLNRSRTSVAVVCGLLTVAALASQLSWARADDVYYSAALSKLKIMEGKLPKDIDATWDSRTPWASYQFFSSYVALDGDGEAYVNPLNIGSLWSRTDDHAANITLAIRVPAARKVTGSLYFRKSDWSGMDRVKFVLEGEPSSDARSTFLHFKQEYYEDLMRRNVAGAAWFRHQIRVVRAEAGQAPDAPDANNPNRPTEDNLENTFDLFSGGRAMSENLQLDRVMRRVVKNEDTVPLDSIKGITVAEIDWKPLLKDLKPALDPLAKLVPADQHVVLFPSFQAFVQVGDRLSQQGTVVMRIAEPQSKDNRLVERYEQQLCLSIHGLGRLIGPQVVNSVALTGSDPYLLSGTDIALVFETTKPELVKDLLLTQAIARSQQIGPCKPTLGEIGGLSYTALRTEDRRVSCYIAVLPGAVLLTNSPYQIERFAAVADKKSPAIATLDEFIFFRNRYPRTDKDESALVFLSDATIRRWCGPRWRIAASRETRDAGVLAELQAEYMDKLVKQQVAVGPLHSDMLLSTGGELTLSNAGVSSSKLGSFDFMTPIAELKFDSVTKTEAESYARWRDGYQTNWRWAFDPIALRLGVSDNRLLADLTIMPLIAGTDYREAIAITRGAKIAPGAGDPHQSLAQLILAINTKSEMFGSVGGFFSQMTPGAKLDPFGWVGQSISIYVDDDSFWQDLAKCETDEAREKFFEHNLDRIPVGVWVEVSSGFKLTGFLTGLRAFAEQTAPGMTHWESFEYNGQPYVKITPTARALGDQPEGERMKPQLFYVASGKFFLLTPSEKVLKNALDRQAAREKGAKGNTKAEVDKQEVVASEKPAGQRLPQPWLGESFGAQVDHQLLPLLAHAFGNQYQHQMQAQCWNNLPILNEWHRLYPDQDPVALHERLWKERLTCPGGGKYVWNEDFQTMESTVYGSPARPKDGPAIPPELLNFRFANFGLTFEEHGLRARLTLDRDVPQEKTPEKPPTKK